VVDYQKYFAEMVKPDIWAGSAAKLDDIQYANASAGPDQSVRLDGDEDNHVQ
jgi:hypothetical protein